MKNRLFAALLGGCLLALFARGPAAAQETGKDELASTLSFELSQLAESWIHGDDAQAAARLDTFSRDNRLRGELPRWLAGMRAALALNAGDTRGAGESLKPLLESADNPRPYLRAARLFVALGAPTEALAIIRQGRARDAASPALRRFEAGLLWLQGRHEDAIDAYINMIGDDKRENYPFVAPEFGDWRNVRPWGGPEKPDGIIQPAGGKDFDDEWEGFDDGRGPGTWTPEPFADLFEFCTWYTTDLPGLERCIMEMAANADAVARARASFTPRHRAAQQAQAALEAFRGGDVVARQDLARAATVARWAALVSARVCVLADFAQGKHADCEVMLNLALEVAQDDTALLDLQARVMAAQGKAEQARTGPLTKLAVQGLTIWTSMLYTRGPQQQAVDRVLEPALRLYKANKEAGLKQFDAVRNAFGPEHIKRIVPQDLIGVWLLQRGEKELARTYLVEAGRQSGFEAGKSLSADGVVLEHALLQLGVPTGPVAAAPEKAEGEPDDVDEGEDEAEEPGAEKPVDPNAPVAPDPNANDPLPLRVAPRAGLLLGSIPEARAVIWRIAGVDFWGGSWGSAPHVRAAQVLPEGDKQLRELLFGYPARLAKEVTPQQLDAALAPEHASTIALQEALKGFGEGLQQAKGGNNWRVVQSLRDRAGFILGMVETRTLLLRARMHQEPPKSMADLSAWLKARQGMIDLRAQFKAAANEETDRLAEERIAAKVPEVAHAGLLLDAAKALARAGDPGGAAKLIWYNRNVVLGIDSRPRRLFLAALLARKAGDLMLETQCRLGALEVSDTRREQPDTTLQLLEITQLRTEIEQFGTKGDLEAYVEGSIVPWADSAGLAHVFAAAPELRQARVTMMMRNSLRGGMDGIFRAAISEGSVSTIDRNWLKMMAPRESYAKCRRFALWVLCCDLPFMRGRSMSNGLNSATDTLRGWTMLAQLAEARSGYDPAQKPEAERLRALIQRCSTPSDEEIESYEEWWD